MKNIVLFIQSKFGLLLVGNQQIIFKTLLKDELLHVVLVQQVYVM